MGGKASAEACRPYHGRPAATNLGRITSRTYAGPIAKWGAAKKARSRCGRLKRNRSYRSDPAANFGWVILVHVEEVSHGRFHNALAGVVWSHGHDSPKDLERPAIPILHHVMMRGKARVDEYFQVLPDRFASMPIGNAEIANCIFRKAVEAFAEGLVIDFFPEC